MAVTYPTTSVRNGMADHIVDQLDSGTVEFQTSGDVEVAAPPFAATAFGAAASGTASIPAAISDTNAAGGTIDHAVFKKSDTTIVLKCSTGTSGADINLTSLAIGAGDTVTISALSYSAPPAA